ncbi:MAG TPA: PAS domain S-box protein [Thermoanaerobaculia bacterium]
MPSLAASTDSVFRLLVDEATEHAIFLLDPQGTIETWNPGAERMFARPPADAVGQNFAILFTEADRADGVAEKELRTARESGRAPDTRWHLRADGRRVFTDGLTTVIRDEGKIIGYAKIARDITERYLTEQRLAAQLALTKLLNQDRPVAEIARRIMQTICENLHWQMGALWEIDEAGERLVQVDEWHDPSLPREVAADFTAGMTFARGEGLPGVVWEKGDAVWLTDISDLARFPRAARAASAGLRAAFAFPILHEGKVQGVMEFFTREAREPDQILLPVMTLIGAQIGDYIARRRTAQVLLESEKKYRAVADTAPDAIFTIDARSTILFCNPAVERVFGYTPEEMTGRSLEMIIPERFRAAHRRGIERYLRTGERHLAWNGAEFIALHRNGHEFPIEISFGEWRSGDQTSFTGYARDMTERKRAADDLERLLDQERQARSEAESVRGQLERRAEEEAAFRHLASALTGAVEMNEVLYEITNRATQVTRADGVYVERLAGPFKHVEVVAAAGRGTPARGLRVAFPGSMTEEIMRGREPVILADMKTFGKSMAPYLADSCPNCEVLVTPLIAEDEPLGALVLLNSRQSGRVFRDADVVRARTLGDLTSLALRRVRLLEQEREAKEKAETAVRVRDETLGIVSHDLRNPLTKIALSADLLVEAQPREQRDLIETIRIAARQMERLIEDLLDVARLEAGRFSVDMKITAAEPVVRDACASNQPIAEQKQQNIVCDVAADLGEICADRDRLIQVFSNLLGNAMKFTPQHGTITISGRPEERHVVFQVIDSGPGLPDADLKNVFRPYWQAKKTAHMGAGLGLAIVSGIVEAHGGHVWAENVRGGGAVFTFTIPRP